jgi:hypothetical protein
MSLPMYLAIVTPEGVVVPVTYDLEEYDLNNSFSRASILSDINNVRKQIINKTSPHLPNKTEVNNKDANKDTEVW